MCTGGSLCDPLWPSVSGPPEPQDRPIWEVEMLDLAVHQRRTYTLWEKLVMLLQARPTGLPVLCDGTSGGDGNVLSLSYGDCWPR